MLRAFMHSFGLWACFVAGAGLLLPAVTYADPPSHAPAHGWRKKHDPYYLGYTGKQWPKDYGVLSGHCNRAAVGAVLGGVVGGAVGSQIGKGDGRTVAIIAGTVLGAVIGAKVGRDMDEADRACFGHALELAKDKQRVEWLNESTGVHYLLTPTRGFKEDGRMCREFIVDTIYEDKKSQKKGKACRAEEGEWRMLN
jgi:surface antigen